MNDISVAYLLKLAWHRLWALALALVVFAGSAFAYCEFLATPRYTATAKVIVTNGSIITNAIQSDGTIKGSSSVSGTDISASLNLANTVKDILLTSDIFKQLSESIDNKYSYRELRNMATVSRAGNDTLIVNVSFSASNDKEAISLVNTFVNLAPDYITNYIPNSVAMVADIADSASEVFPRTAITTSVVGLIGVILAFAVVFIIDSMDHAIDGEEDFTNRYDVPLLGAVPDFENTVIGSNNYYNYGRKGGYPSGN